jgi:netrin-G1 ligand/leucine-rich repeat/fibronectin type-III domain-containing protein 5
VPTLYWIRPDGTTETYYSPKGDEAEQNEGVLYMTNVRLTDSTKYKCVASNPAGNVTFSLNVVWPPPPPTTTTVKTTTTTTLKTTEAPKPKGNVIVADSATAKPSMRDNTMLGDGRAEEGGHWDGGHRPGINMGSQGDDDVVVGPGSASGRAGLGGTSGKTDARFTIIDVVGAVVGTFLLTVLLSVLAAQLYYRYVVLETSVNRVFFIFRHKLF